MSAACRFSRSPNTVPQLQAMPGALLLLLLLLLLGGTREGTCRISLRACLCARYTRHPILVLCKCERKTAQEEDLPIASIR